MYPGLMTITGRLVKATTSAGDCQSADVLLPLGPGCPRTRVIPGPLCSYNMGIQVPGCNGKRENSAGPSLNPGPTSLISARPKLGSNAFKPRLSPIREGAVGALKTKGIPGESGKLLGWKVIKGQSMGGDFHRKSQAQEQAWAVYGAMVPIKPKSLET